MPGAGTDKTRNWIETPGPVVILVEPQLGENIGAVARVMANFGLGRLRLVKPRDGWPNTHAAALGLGRRPHPRRCGTVRHAGGGDCRLHRRSGDDGARARPGEARGRPRRGGLASWRRTSPRARRSPCCSGASAMGSRTTRSRSPTASSRFRSIRRSRRSTSPRRSRSIAYEWFKLASGGALPFAMPRKSDAGRQGAGAGLLRQSRTRAR